MRSIILMMLLSVLATNAMASSKDSSALDKRIHEFEKVTAVFQALDNDLYWQKILNGSSKDRCKKLHDYINKKVRGSEKQDLITVNLSHAEIAADYCHEEQKILAAYYSEAVKKGSVLAQSDLDEMIDIDDFKVGGSSLQGRKVGIEGLGQYIMNVFYLRKNSNDANPLVVDISEIPESQKHEVLKKCGNIQMGCNLIVYGLVDDNRIDASLLSIRSE